MPLLPGYADELAQKADYIGFSTLNESVKTPSVQLMTAAEVYFLKAEAALRGWAGAGDAQSNYEQGIMTSFNQRGASGADVAGARGGGARDDTGLPPQAIGF